MNGFPSVSPVGERRQARLADARLAVVVDTGRDGRDLEALLRAVCGASVDIVRLRDDTATEDALRRTADVVRRVCDDAGALFLLDRLAGLAVQVGADGVHLGEVDADPDHARRVAGPDALVGLGLRSARSVAASGDEDVDLIVLGDDVTGAVAPELITAAETACQPWFVATDGPRTAIERIRSGARRVLLCGGLDGSDPATACWEVRRALAGQPLD